MSPLSIRSGAKPDDAIIESSKKDWEIRDRVQVTDVVASSHQESEYAIPTVPEDQPVCWICLDYATGTQPLVQPCRCPRQAHPTCVARWQLQSAGTRKETHCEFCDQDLPDWKKTLTPQCGANAPAIMNVNFNERTFSFEVKPGIQGYRDFTNSIRQAFGLPEDSELNITFTCDEPVISQTEFPGEASPAHELIGPSTPAPSPCTPRMDSDLATPPSTPTSASLLTLQGAGAYDAAVHCASVSAAKRMSQSGPNTPVHSPSSRHSCSPPPRHRPSYAPSAPSILSRQPFSNIPGYNMTLPSSSYRERNPPIPQHLPPFGISPPFRGLTNMPNLDEPRIASVPRRNSTANMIQRATKAVRKFTGRKEREYCNSL